jgi:hypothetical protein
MTKDLFDEEHEIVISLGGDNYGRGRKADWR